MCNYKTLQHNSNGYVVQCRNCNHIQVAFGTTIVSFSREQFYEFISVIDEQYQLHSLCLQRAKKMVHVHTPSGNLAMIYSVNELSALLYLLVEGRNALEFNELFVFNNN